MKASIPLDRVEKIAREAGCTVDVKSSYIRITKNGKENCLFVHKTKSVSAIDVGGFDIPDEKIARNLGGESHGSVHQVLRTDMPDAQFVSNFRSVCLQLDQYKPREKKARERPHAFAGSKKNPVESVVVVSTEETPQQTIDRLVAKITLIRKVADEHGVPVSPKTEKEIAEQLEKARKQIGA